MNTKYISNDIYKMVNEMRQLVLLYGKNCFIATAVGEIENGLREYAKAAVIVAKHDIPPIVEKYGYCVEFDDNSYYKDKIVFRRKDTAFKKEGYPDYFRVDSFSGNIID